MAKVSVSNSVNINDPHSTAINPRLPAALQKEAKEVSKWLLNDIQIPSTLSQQYKIQAARIKETDSAVIKLQEDILKLEDKRERNILVRAWNHIKGTSILEIEAQTIENKVAELDNWLTKRNIALNSMKKLEADFLSVSDSAQERAKLAASQTARVQAYRMQDEAFVCKLLEIERSGENRLSQRTVDIVRTIVLSNQKSRLDQLEQTAQAIETLSKGSLSESNKSQLAVLKYSQNIVTAKGYLQFIDYIKTETEFRDDSAYSFLKYDSLPFVFAIAITTFTGGVASGVAIPLALRLSGFLARGAITRSLVSFGANYLASSVLMGIGTVGGEQAGKEINNIVLNSLENLQRIDKQDLKKGGSLIRKYEEIGVDGVALTYAEQVRRNVVMNFGTQVLGLGFGKFIGATLSPLKNFAGKVFSRGIVGKEATKSLGRGIVTELVEESAENVIAAGAELTSRTEQLSRLNPLLKKLGLGAYADTGGTLLLALKVALTGKGLKHRRTHPQDFAINEESNAAGDIQSVIAQAQRSENPQDVSPNLRASENLILYGQSFKGVRSTDGKYFYLDNPLDIQVVCQLAVTQRAAKKHLDPKTIAEILLKAENVSAFYDQENDLIISPRVSLFTDQTTREILSGVIRHEKAHKEGKDELGALQEQRDSYANRGISFYLEDGELIVDKEIDSVRSASNQELEEYVANNPNSELEELGIFTIKRGKTYKQKIIASRIIGIFADHLSGEFTGDPLYSLNRILKDYNSDYNLKEFCEEILELNTNNTNQLKKQGFSQTGIRILQKWVSQHKQDLIQRALVDRDIVEVSNSRRTVLTKRFEKLEMQLGTLLKEGKTKDITQETLNHIAELYGVPGDERERICPSTFKINLEAGGFTDFPSDGEYTNKVKWIHIYNVLNADALKDLDNHHGPQAGEIARVAVLDVIWRDVKARLAATKMKLRHVQLGNKEYPVWNNVTTPRLSWTKADLAGLRRKLEKSKTFELPDIDPQFGLSRTSETIHPDMADRQWTTDSCITAALKLRQIAPHLAVRNFITNATFILNPKNLEAATAAILDPKWYRESDASHGISHIYQRAELLWDEENRVPKKESVVPARGWGNNKRLESQALLLNYLIETIIAGACLGEQRGELTKRAAIWGFNWTEKNKDSFSIENEPLSKLQKEHIISAIQILASYLLSVEWNVDTQTYDLKAPTVSAWEEAPRPGGCASDTGFMVDAMSSLKDLLFNPAFNDNQIITEVRESLNNKLPLFADSQDGETLLQAHPYADFRSKDNLESFILQGQTLLREMVIRPITRAIDAGIVAPPAGVEQFPDCNADSSLMLLAAGHKSFGPSLAWNAKMRYGLVLAAKTHLTKNHPKDCLGMNRYAAYWSEECQQWLIDSYLSYEFELGLIVPGLVEPGFAKHIAEAYQKNAEHIVDRIQAGIAGPRDSILQAAHDRLFGPGKGNQPTEAKKDAHNPKAMLGRQQFSLPEWVAQWTIGPTAAVIALGRAKSEILEYIKETINPNTGKFEEEWVLDLLHQVNEDLTFFINLCTSTLVQDIDAKGKPVLRADGTLLPKGKLSMMECFQAVLDVEGKVVFRPGQHTLPWSTVQLDDGLSWAERAAEDEELLREEGVLPPVLTI